MNPNNYFMIDIETTGVIPSKHYVTSVGVVQFRMDEDGCEILDKYEFALTPDRTSRIKDPDTMAWRKKNGVDKAEENIKLVYPWGNLLTALIGLNNWMKLAAEGSTDIRVYAHHCNFDFGFLDSMYREFDYAPYWKFWQVRDDETFVEAKANCTFKVAAKAVPFQGHAHTAVDDAAHQVRVMHEAIQIRNRVFDGALRRLVKRVEELETNHAIYEGGARLPEQSLGQIVINDNDPTRSALGG